MRLHCCRWLLTFWGMAVSWWCARYLSVLHWRWDCICSIHWKTGKAAVIVHKIEVRWMMSVHLEGISGVNGSLMRELLSWTDTLTRISSWRVFSGVFLFALFLGHLPNFLINQYLPFRCFKEGGGGICSTEKSIFFLQGSFRPVAIHFRSDLHLSLFLFNCWKSSLEHFMCGIIEIII